MTRGFVAALICLLALVVPGGEGPARACVAPRPGPPPRVLFVGNSYTRFNNLARTVARISESVPGGVTLRTAAVAHPGWDLSRHWYAHEARTEIRRGRYTHVVLQGHSMSAIADPDEFAGFARLFAEQAAATGARTVLYETWARRGGSFFYRRGRGHDAQLDSSEDMQQRVSALYTDVARELAADLAPAGRAFLRAGELLPHADQLLYQRDGSHPTQAGTYLAGLVIYGTITHRDPRRVRYRPYPMTREVGESLREIAWQTLQAQPRLTAALPH